MNAYWYTDLSASCGVGLTIAPLQNPYNLSLPLNPYGVLQQLTFYCNTFNSGNIGFIGCGEVPVHGSLSNGAGNEFTNLNIANGIWGGLDSLIYYFDGSFNGFKDPRPAAQPTQIVTCNGISIANVIENRIYNSNQPPFDLCSPVPIMPNSLATDKEESGNKYIVFPNPNYDGKLHIKATKDMTNTYCEIFDARGVLVYGCKIYTEELGLMLPEKAGLYFVFLSQSGGNIKRFKVIRL